MTTDSKTPQQMRSVFDGTPGLRDWIAGDGCAIAFTTYQAGRLILVGLGEGERLRAHERYIPRCQGLWSDGRRLWVGGESHLWRFDDVAAAFQTDGNVDRLYAPQQGHSTGDVDIHDIAVDADGQVIFVNTRYSCLATLDAENGFRPLWRPPFISEIKGEDRCHMNGLALGDDGRPAFVTALGRADVIEGWRDHRVAGGVVIDVASGEVACGGLSMPHSPRWRDGQLWLLNSGTGELGTVDLNTGRFEPLCFCPGYARGLSFFGKWAVVGLSRPRSGNSTFEGLLLDERLQKKGVAPRCGFVVVDTTTGTLAHAFIAHHTIDELYDVVMLPAVRRPAAVGLAEAGFLKRHS